MGFRFLAARLLAGAIGAHGASAEPTPSAPKDPPGGGTTALERTLVRLEKEAWERFQNVDFSDFNAGHTPDFVAIGYAPDGVGFWTREEILAGLKAAADDPSLPRISDYSLTGFRLIPLARDAALLTYRAKVAAGDWSRDLYATTVWVRRDGRWRAAFYQATAVAPAPAPGGTAPQSEPEQD